MPYIANTPESILSRSDSLTPATTCRGVTANGRPCRRALAASTSASPSSSPSKDAGVQQKTDLALLYCWQHRDQAVSASNGVGTSNRPNTSQVKPRTSIDTLMDKLGVLEIKDEQATVNKHQRRKQTRRTVCCCFEVVDDDDKDHRPPRPVYALNSASSQHAAQYIPQESPGLYTGTSGRPSQSTSPLPHQISHRPPLQSTQNSSSPQTKDSLSWIPQSLSPQTTSVLLSELAKPISEADEPGYIYMFWVTPSTSTISPPPLEVARSLIPTAQTPTHSHSVSDAIQKARDLNVLTSKPTNQDPGMIRLKIGRASNVQRRLNEWTRQCSHHLILIRYYPYTPSTSSSHGGGDNGASLEPGRKVPHVHRVERLIHLELGENRLRDLGRCAECGKEHREWFEFAAEKQDLKRVDDCIRRWVEWAESQSK